jgi:hypothetical protein
MSEGGDPMNGEQGPKGEQGLTAPQVKLAEVVAKATPPPEPPRWVQGWQMFFAGVLFVAALGLAFFLVAEGPPAPKAPEGSTEAVEETPESPAPGDSGQKETSAIRFTAEAEPSPPDGGGESGTEPGDSGESPAPAPSDPEDDGSDDGSEDGSAGNGASEEEDSSGESLASLNEQAPWAFAIVALLVATFLATGKTLSFAGTSSGERRTQAEGDQK